MAFKPMVEYGDRVPTIKPNERVLVQGVELSDKDGKNVREVLDVRVQYTAPDGRWLSGKTGFILPNKGAVEVLADALMAAIDDGFEGFDPSAQNNGESDDRPKVRQVKRRKRSAAAPAAKKVRTPRARK